MWSAAEGPDYTRQHDLADEMSYIEQAALSRLFVYSQLQYSHQLRMLHEHDACPAPADPW